MSPSAARQPHRLVRLMLTVGTIAIVCGGLAARCGASDAASSTEAPSARSLEESIERITSLGPVTPPYIARELRGREHSLLRADIPSKKDLASRAKALGGSDTSRAFAAKAGMVLAPTLIPKDLERMILGVRAWPFLESWSLFTAYEASSTKVWIREWGNGLEVAFAPVSTRAEPAASAPDTGRFLALVEEHLSEAMRPKDVQSLNLKTLRAKGLQLWMGRLNVPERTFDVGGVPFRLGSVLVFVTDGTYLKMWWPRMPESVPMDGFTWAGDADTGLLPIPGEPKTAG